MGAAEKAEKAFQQSLFYPPLPFTIFKILRTFSVFMLILPVFNHFQPRIFKQDLCFYNVYIVNVCIFPVNGGVAIVTFLSREQISYRNY